MSEKMEKIKEQNIYKFWSELFNLESCDKDALNEIRKAMIGGYIMISDIVRYKDEDAIE